MSESLLEALLPSLYGLQNARYLALASFTFLVYDHCLTLSDEFKHFWTGRWTLARSLFLINRYSILINFAFVLACFYEPGLTVEFCTATIRSLFVVNVFQAIVIQAILVIRIYYIYSHSRPLQVLLLVCFALCCIAAFIFMSRSFHSLDPFTVDIPGFSLLGCAVPPSQNSWQLFIPPFAFHTILFVFTTARSLRPNRNPIEVRMTPFRTRLMRDGGIFYVIVFLSVGWSGIGALLYDIPLISIPAIYSNFMLAISSASVSRLMLNIRSLAAGLTFDSNWVLNHAEMKRLRLKQGATGSELLVEIDSRERVVGVSNSLVPTLDHESSSAISASTYSDEGGSVILHDVGHHRIPSDPNCGPQSPPLVPIHFYNEGELLLMYI